MIFKSNHTLKNIRALSAAVEKRISQLQSEKLKDLDLEELHDLNRILQMADYVLCKHEDRRHVYNVLKDFVDVLEASCTSVESLEDGIDELVLRADHLLTRIKTIRSNVFDAFSLIRDDSVQIGANNLTKSSRGAYTIAYQQTSQPKAEKVV